MCAKQDLEEKAIDSEPPFAGQRIARIVVGVDGSPGAMLALEWAGSEAERCGALLTVVGAWARGGFGGAVVTEEGARQVLEEAAQVAAEQHPGVTGKHELCKEPAAEALIEASRDADLLVVESRGFGGFHGLLFGSVGQHCMTHAACSVVVVRASEGSGNGGAGMAPGHIVVGVDGSEGSDLALDWALDEARRTAARLDVVGSWVFPGSSGYVFTAIVGIPDAAQQVVATALARIARIAPEVVARGTTSEDPPAVALKEASRGAQLLVVGSRGLDAFRGLLLGSVSQYLANHAHCSVAVVRGLKVA